MTELTPYREKTLRREHKDARRRLRIAEDRLGIVRDYVEQLETFVADVRDFPGIPPAVRSAALDLLPEIDDAAVVAPDDLA